MKQIYIAFLLLLVCQLGIAGEKNILLVPSATIAVVGSATVCENTTGVLIRFTGSGGTAPYTFTYKINSSANLTVSTTSGNSVTVAVPTGTAGTITYTLVSVRDSVPPSNEQNINGQVATITVATPPIVGFTFNNNNTCSGTSIQFTSSVSGAGSNIYSWDFGDGSPLSNVQNPTHTFTSLGCGDATFTVNLTVVKNGCTVTTQRTVLVKQKPDISFGDVINPFDPFSNCSNASFNPVFSVTVGNNSTSTCISSFSINWGDGNIQNSITFPISHTYSSTGAYSMVISAIGTNGCSNSKTYIIKNVSNPLGGINSPGSTTNLCAPTSNLQFSISSWGTNSLDTTYTINYGDGSPIQVLTQNQMIASGYYDVANPSNSSSYPIPHVYTTSSCPATSFILTLDITNACATTPLTLGNILILIKPTADFTVPPNRCVNTSVLFTNTTTNGYGQNCSQSSVYTWDFGDGSPIITTPLGPPTNINHTYTTPGTYTVKLTAQNFCGTTPKTQQVCIEPPLTPLFTLNPTSDCTPVSVTASNNTSLINQCATPTYLWEVTHTPLYCATTTVTIPNQTTANASYNFTEPGTYSIKLTVTNSCGSFNTTQTVTVKKPPTASIATISNSCGSASITPNATVTNCAPAGGTITYVWSFPGGTPSSATTLNPGTISYPAGGPYIVSLVASNECGPSNTATQTFSVNTAAAITNTSLNQTICSGSSTTLVNLTANPFGTTFSWIATATAGISGFTPSGTTNTIPAQTITTTNTSPGTVTYVITPSVGGCSGLDVNYEVTVNPAPTITTQPASSAVCLGGTPTPLTVALNSSSVTPTYQWYSNTANSTSGGTSISGGTNATYNPPATAVVTLYYYCIISLSSGGCSSLTSNVAEVKITPILTITTQPNPTQSLCVGVTIPTPLTVAYSGGAGTATYQWYSNTSPLTTGGTLISGETNSNYTPPVFTTAGLYYYYAVISLAGINCGAITSNLAQINVIADPLITTQPLPSQTVCQNSPATILSVIASGGIGTTYDYQWYSSTVSTNTSGTLLVGETNNTYTPLTNTAGALYYYCIITQTATLGCSVTSAVATVTVNLAPTVVNQPPSSTICLGALPTTLSLTYVNGAGTPNYQWYSNTINSNSGGTLITGATNATFPPPATPAGTVYYYCEVTFPSIVGSCSLITTNAAEVTINQNPVIATETKVICSSTSFTVSPSTTSGNIIPLGTTYTWTAPTINPSGSITGAASETLPQTSISQTLINNTANPATVTYTVIPASGTCIGNSFTVTVTVNPAINPDVVLTNNTCFGVNNASITTNITGGIPFSSGAPYQLSWTGPNSYTSSATSISNIQPGTYNVTIADAGGCPFSNSYTITEPTDIVITVDSENDITCYNANNGSINISLTGGTGAYSYSWTKNTAPYAITEDLSNLAPGTYEVSVTDANNCGPKIASFTITEPPLLVVSLVSQTNVLCYGAATGAITVGVVGGTQIPTTLEYTYAWTGPNGFTANTQNLSNLVAGTYNLTVTDANGCIKNLSVIITQSTEIIIAYTTTPITCYGANNASMSVSLSGGNPSYLFQWSNLSTSLSQNNLSAGNYTITVTDNVGCPKTATIVIPDAPVFMVNPIVTQITCHGANNGSINLNLTGGIAPVVLSWSDGSTDGLIRNNLAPGTYIATISDGTPTPCRLSPTFTIIQPLPLVLSANLTNAFDCTNASSGVINLVVAGGILPYTYSWSNGATTADLSNLTSGNYLVIVTDDNGCTANDQYQIIRPAPIQINVTTQTTFDCDAHTVNQNFVAQASGGVPPYAFRWSSGTISGANNEIMNTNTNGTVLLTVTDRNNCSATYTVTVATPILGYPSFDTTSYGYTTYGLYATDDPIQFQSNLTGDYISVSWDFGDGTFSTELNPIHTYLIPKEYVVTQTVTYPFGCVYGQTISLLVEKGYVLVVPTAFTPNNDRLNDTYRPVTKALKNIVLDIYDSWGSLIYSETGDVLVGWDGKIKGFNAENGNYYSKVRAETFYGTIVNSNQTFVLIK